MRKYYYLAGRRVAMRRDGVVYYLHGDHLGSTSLTTDESGNVVAAQHYSPYGEVRGSDGDLPTDFTFTGQRGEAAFGLLDYHARWYSPRLGRFVSADTIAPGDETWWVGNGANPGVLGEQLILLGGERNLGK